MVINNKNDTNNMSEEQQPLSKLQMTENRLDESKAKLTSQVKALNHKLCKFSELPELQQEVYGFKQDTIDAYNSALTLLAKMNSQYTKDYNKQFIDYKNGTHKRSNNFRYDDRHIDMIISRDKAEEKLIINIIDIHCKFIRETLKNIDDIIWGIKNRIELYKLINRVE